MKVATLVTVLQPQNVSTAPKVISGQEPQSSADFVQEAQGRLLIFRILRALTLREFATYHAREVVMFAVE